MTLLNQLMLGGLMIGLTVAIQAVFLDIIMRRVEHVAHYLRHRIYAWKPIMSGLLVMTVFSVHVLQIWLWAFLYLELKAVPITTFSEALYFSTVTFSTVGYGDITLSHSTRMLSAIEAANGFLVFGWTTAFIFEVISKLYKFETKSL